MLAADALDLDAQRALATTIAARFDGLDVVVLLRPGASVVVTGSNAALGGFPNGSVYGASKAAISLMSLGIPAEQREAAKRDVVAGVPVGRMGDPVEIAAAIVFLAGDEAAFATGTDLVIDGGVKRVHVG